MTPGERTNPLSDRDKEFTALGAAIASNCIPCIEYHIRQARKEGLSDTEIREAVELADKVRRVPAGNVLKTAFALLESTGERPASGLDVRPPREDNVPGSDDGSADENRKDTCDPGGASNESRDTAQQTGLPSSQMMEMMRRCCPDRVSDFWSMMSANQGCCCSSGEDDSEGPA